MRSACATTLRPYSALGAASAAAAEASPSSPASALKRASFSCWALMKASLKRFASVIFMLASDSDMTGTSPSVTHSRCWRNGWQACRLQARLRTRLPRRSTPSCGPSRRWGIASYRVQLYDPVSMKTCSAEEEGLLRGNKGVHKAALAWSCVLSVTATYRSDSRKL